MSETDILIVGAGPAGTYLAEKLSLKGIDVTVIEKKRVIGKHACSGLVSTRLDRFVKPKECYIENRIYGSTFHSKDSQFTVRKGDMQAYVLNRPVFDRCMADKATTAGAKIKTETIFEAYSVRNHYAYAETDKGVIRSKIIIGCDGAGSTVRRAAGLDKKKHCVNGIIGYSDEKDYSNRVELFYGKDIAPGFFAWKIPRGRTTEYGLAADNDHIKYFEKFTEKFSVEIKKYYTHPICFGLLNTTVSDNIMLLGDAALQVKPFSGGGIIYSFICADIAAKVISDALIENSFTAKVLAEYDRRWKSHLAEKIKIGLGIRQTLNNLSDTELDTFFSLMSHNRKSIENFGDMDFL